MGNALLTSNPSGWPRGGLDVALPLCSTVATSAWPKVVLEAGLCMCAMRSSGGPVDACWLIICQLLE